jgi:hypothetical protein
MPKYKAIVHYNFKKGMEEEGLRFLENELLKKAQDYGCHNIELWQNERDSCCFIGTASWNSLEEARKFQSVWNAKENQLVRYCTNAPTREFYEIRSTWNERGKKAA